jgi:hypothetical protein
MLELNGSIAAPDLLVIIQFLADQRRTGRLCLSRSPDSGELDFADGRVVAACFGDTCGLAALPALLRVFRDEQLFFFYCDDPPHTSCPKLGFVDAPSGHYGRPTALHRCYAAAHAQPIASKQQSQFCLSGCFHTCPRFTTTQGDHG